jgi:ornithine cyclodeaminase/alanine dehydrogenase-like protein (mu-crystallin family)
MRLVGGALVDRLVSFELGLAVAQQTSKLVASGGFSTARVQVGDERVWMRILAGIVPSLDVVGYKEFHRVDKDVYYHVSLFSHGSGEALGIVDGRRITSLRTASTAALAMQRGLGSDPISLAVIGSGEEAREGLRAVAAAVSVGRVAVFSPTPTNRESFAASMSSELDISVEPVESVAAALAGVEAAYVATAARKPVVRAGEVGGLRMIAAVGATRPEHHELSGDVVALASCVIVDCVDATQESGDMIDAVSHFGWSASDAVLLGDWMEGPAHASESPGLLLFKSIGSVEQDILLAHRLLLAAEEAGLGEVVDPVGTVRVMR